MNRIVIEVTDELYKSLMLGYQDPYIKAFGDCVRSGTLLPKGHGRLIDADALQKQAVKVKLECVAREIEVVTKNQIKEAAAIPIIEADKETASEVLVQ